MPQKKFDVIDVINALGLEINPRQSPQMPSFNVRCPFCDDKKYHMNVNTEKDLYKCFRCGDKGGTVVATGTPEEVALVEGSYTGQYLKKVLGERHGK